MRIKKYNSYSDDWEIHKICKEYDITQYTINKDGSIDVDKTVHLQNRKLWRLPLKFNKVNGDFNCYGNKLESLAGSPKKVTGGFFCNGNNLISLKYLPVKIGEGLNCASNRLTSLEGCPKEIKGFFHCQNNKLSTMKGGPKEVRDNFYCHNNNITSLEKFPYITTNTNFYYFYNNPVHLIIKYFIPQGIDEVETTNILKNNNLVELFNDCDIIRDKSIILDRLQFFFDEINVKLTEEMLKDMKSFYEII